MDKLNQKKKKRDYIERSGSFLRILLSTDKKHLRNLRVVNAEFNYYSLLSYIKMEDEMQLIQLAS